MPSTCFPLRLFTVQAGLFLATISLFVAGCSSQVVLAPRSSLSRERAVMMAQRTAEAAGGRVFTIAPTGSMKPTLDENSVVTVEFVDFVQLRQGDIVIYRNSSGIPIVHRLYEKSGSSWFVLGDNNGRVDREAVTLENLLGRVCAIFYTSPTKQDGSLVAMARH